MRLRFLYQLLDRKKTWDEDLLCQNSHLQKKWWGFFCNVFVACGCFLGMISIWDVKLPSVREILCFDLMTSHLGYLNISSNWTYLRKH